MADSWEGLGTLSTRFVERPNWLKPVKSNTQFNRELLMFPPSAVDFTELSVNGYALSFEYGFENMEREQAFDVVDFFDDRVGRLKRFWVPLWVNMFSLYEPITNGDSDIKINPSLFPLTTIQTYQRVFIHTKSGDSISRRSDNVYDVTTHDSISLITPMDRDLTQDEIEVFSVLILCRFDHDVLEMAHASAGVSSATLRFAELLGEYNNIA